ncbi:DUF6193 family natural product biosynthesis protein [Streptomyces sp. NPDC002911]
MHTRASRQGLPAYRALVEAAYGEHSLRELGPSTSHRTLRFSAAPVLASPSSRCAAATTIPQATKVAARQMPSSPRPVTPDRRRLAGAAGRAPTRAARCAPACSS